MSERIIPLLEVRASDYNDLADLAEIFRHEIIEDQSGVWRWKQNRLSRFICDQINLNNVWIALHRGDFSMEELMKFYMQIGYSLDGFIEVFGQHEASEFSLAGAKPPDPNNDDYTETILEYMRRTYCGGSLKL